MSYDLVVIGSGPGGYVAAIRAAQLGLKTACVEKYPTLGGTCLNVGCIPSKALLDSTENLHHVKHGLAVHGIRATAEFDLATMMKRKDTVVRGLTSGVGTLFKKYGVAPVFGFGRIESPGRVEVKGESGAQTLDTQRILIATGSKAAALPGVAFDGRRIVHSTDALALPEVPRRLMVVGAGAIGLELGSVWMRLGSEVRVLEFQDRILPGVDRGSGAMLKKILERQGFRFELETSARAARVEGNEVRVTIDSKGITREEACEVLLVAVGRRPYTEGLGAREAGVELDEKGRVRVNERYETRVPGIFAIGDVTAGPMLAHKAEEEGIAAVENMAGRAGHVSYDCIPNVVYTWPELASVGLTVEEAERQRREVRVGTFPFMVNGRARAMNERDGQVALVADSATDRLLGAHILGPWASDLIAELVVAMEMGASSEDVARSVHAHPTLAEAIKEAALAVTGSPIHI